MPCRLRAIPLPFADELPTGTSGARFRAPATDATGNLEPNSAMLRTGPGGLHHSKVLYGGKGNDCTTGARIRASSAGAIGGRHCLELTLCFIESSPLFLDGGWIAGRPRLWIAVRHIKDFLVGRKCVITWLPRAGTYRANRVCRTFPLRWHVSRTVYPRWGSSHCGSWLTTA